MRPQAAIALIEQSLLLHKSEQIGALDFLDMVAVTLQTIDVPADRSSPGEHGRLAEEGESAARVTSAATGSPHPADQDGGIGATVRRLFKKDPARLQQPGSPAGAHAAPNAPLDIDAPDGAMTAVLGANLRDYQQGKIDREEMLGYVERRTEEIRQMRRDARQTKDPARCTKCGHLATAVIAGAEYCDAHAADARPPLPMSVGA